MKIYDVLILGGGASSLMCGAHLSKEMSVAIVDTNSKVAQKLKISGGGKCNITNTIMSQRNFDGDEELISSVLSRFSRDDLLEFLKQHGLSPVVRKNRYYFCKDSSDEIINILKKLTSKNTFFLNTEILEVCKKDEIFSVKTDRGEIKARRVIVATGAKSYKTLGASEIGLEIAKSFGILNKEFTPALVGLTLQKEQFWMKELSGLSCSVRIKVEDRVLEEDLLFAHKGISGPVILSTSLYWRKGNIEIDFLPNEDILELTKGSKKLISSVIPLPKRLSVAILKALDVVDLECKKITKEQREKLVNIHNYEFAPAGNFGFTKAEVCRGGVLADELNFKNLESKRVKNLHFIGEVVDVTGELGGYNFQWAFSSGVVCAREINNSIS
ncbi:MAG: aminoacetone oxidase family FAD-binding enzyme [Sulfurimonas sp.]|uniref:NAD(P)/FAD-dependent oxidoreductase n=1 Tax=Sulfurimonas sp. TaxID=2022749 RepID=UPI0025DA6326|nr:aminoacetone oxidase family FAD-binding enzyme [Sulfurimonas sp.]MCK9491122.1 aminoacetone oxidase family FAD-binding enzyme [Sulfurimonas sp.]